MFVEEVTHGHGTWSPHPLCSLGKGLNCVKNLLCIVFCHEAQKMNLLFQQP